MENIVKDLLRRDECQPLTQAQINYIKARTATRPRPNVYIAPYHIYDEDGEEQVVGEVRKTIDGVKKKKPVYEKIVDMNTTSYSIPNTEELLEYSCFITTLDGNVPYYGYTYTDANNYKYWSYFFNNAVIVGVQNFSFSKARLIYRYTKTTDTWEVV